METLKMHWEFQQLNNGAYTSKFFMQTFENCEHAWKYGQTTMKGLFGSAGYNMTKCPLPAGTYFVKDWNINLQADNVPTYIYGSYKMITSYTKDKKRVGCFIIYADFIQK